MSKPSKNGQSSPPLPPQETPNVSNEENHADSPLPADTDPALRDPIDEAETLKEALRQAHVQTGRLLASLRRQRKQARLVQTTLASLRQLQNIG